MNDSVIGYYQYYVPWLLWLKSLDINLKSDYYYSFIGLKSPRVLAAYFTGTWFGITFFRLYAWNSNLGYHSWKAFGSLNIILCYQGFSSLSKLIRINDFSDKNIEVGINHRLFGMHKTFYF